MLLALYSRFFRCICIWPLALLAPHCLHLTPCVFLHLTCCTSLIASGSRASCDRGVAASRPVAGVGDVVGVGGGPDVMRVGGGQRLPDLLQLWAPRQGSIPSFLVLGYHYLVLNHCPCVHGDPSVSAVTPPLTMVRSTDHCALWVCDQDYIESPWNLNNLPLNVSYPPQQPAP